MALKHLRSWSGMPRRSRRANQSSSKSGRSVPVALPTCRIFVSETWLVPIGPRTHCFPTIGFRSSDAKFSARHGSQSDLIADDYHLTAGFVCLHGAVGLAYLVEAAVVEAVDVDRAVFRGVHVNSSRGS